MRKLYILVMLLLAAFISKTNAQEIQWGKGFNPPNSGDNNYIYLESHCTDPHNNTYTTGHFARTIDFNIGGTPYLVTAQTNSEGFIAKYDKNGSVKFVQRLQGSFVSIYSIVTDNKGSLYIAGTLANQTYFDPTGANFPLTRGGFIAKYDTSGNFIYAKKIGYWVKNLYADKEQNIYACGFYEAGNDMDPGEAVLHLPAYGNRDVFFAKFTPSGDLVFAKGIGGPGNDMGGNNYDCNIAANSSGEIILSGTISGYDMDFDPGEETSIITEYSETGYIAHYSSTGELIKAGAIRNSSNYVHDMYVDANDNIFITGEFNGTVNFNFDPANNAGVTSAGMQDIYFAKYDSDLKLVFAKKMGGTSTDRGFGIEIDALGYINVIGDFYNRADLDPSSVVKNYGTGTNTYHLFLAKYTAEGNLVKANYLAGNLTPSPFTITSSGDIYLASKLFSSADFDFGDGTFMLERNTNISSYLVKYTQSPELKVWHNGRIGNDTEIDFGAADLETSTEAKEFYIKNTGDWKLDFTNNPAITISGAAIADFSIDQSLLNASILQGDSIKFTVVFTPTEAGERTAQIVINTNSPLTPEFIIHLTGTGIQKFPEVKLWNNGRIEEGAETDFGSADLGTNADAKEYYIRNTGEWTLEFTESPAITLSGMGKDDFTIDQSLLESSLLPGDSVKFTVSFTPSAEGERSAQLIVHNNSPQTPEFTIHLKGTGIPPVTSISKASDSRIVLYPNPSTDGHITIESPERLTEITVTNSIGQREVFHTASFTTSLKGILTVVMKTDSNVYIDRICIK